MGLFQTLFGGRLNLTTTDRQAIFKLFGSFAANRLGQSTQAQIEQGYEGNTDVFSVIKKITDTAKVVPWVVERKTSEGWEVVNDTPINELMDQPNKAKQYTWESIQEQKLIYLLASGNAYELGLEAEGFKGFQALDVLPSPLTTVQSNNDFLTPLKSYDLTINGRTMRFEQDEIGHVNFFNPGYTTVTEACDGLSPIRVAAMVVKASTDRTDADANLLQNRGAIGLVTDKSQRPMLADEAEKVQSSFQQRVGGTGNFGKVVVTNKDLNYIQMAMSSADLQLIEKGVNYLRAICNVYGVDSSLFNDPANKTFNNRKEAEKALYTNAVMPTLDKMSAKYNAWLVPSFGLSGTHRMRPDYSSIEALQSDKKLEAEKDKIFMDGVAVALNMPISAEAKQRLLIDQFDFSMEQAQAITTPEGTKNDTLETLKSLSPLLANKLVENLSEEEIRKLLGL